MFEHRSQPLLTKIEFGRRLLFSLAVTATIVAASLLLGTLGYHRLGGMPWATAFHHTCLMLSGHYVDPEAPTAVARIFAGSFVLYARIIFVALVAILLVPVLHRILHVLHLDPKLIDEEDESRE